MGKGKPRKYPDKIQNQLGGVCQWSEENILTGELICELGKDIKICEGNPHNCIKVKYKILASQRR